jgi:RNA 3'-terminal phosphate cyclase (ATP)
LARLIPIEGLEGKSSGQELRAALALSATSGQGFQMVGHAGASRGTGLRVPHLAAVRAAAMACSARLSGAFEGSLELRFEPGVPTAGAFEFSLDGSTSVMLVLQAVLSILAAGSGESQVVARGPTHFSGSPTYHFVERHWLPLIGELGLRASLSLTRAGFPPRVDGEVAAHVSGPRGGEALVCDVRGDLLEVRGLSAAAPRQQGDAARRARDAARNLLWERRRLEVAWETPSLPAGSPGSLAQMELVFERGRAAFSALGERRVRPEVAGERLARRCLRFLDGDAALDGHVADQLIVPMATSGQGGRLAVEVLTPQLLSVARVATAFGFEVKVVGRPGGPGHVEVGRS